MGTPRWAWAVAALLAALGVLLFFQFKDPMILIFGFLLAGMLLGGIALARVLRGGLGGVRVKCRECGALNLENANFCSQCGRSL